MIYYLERRSDGRDRHKWMNAFVEINWPFFLIQAFSRKRGRHLSRWLKTCMKWMRDMPLGASYVKHIKANSVEYHWEEKTIWRLNRFLNFWLIMLYSEQLHLWGSALGTDLNPFCWGLSAGPHIASPFLFSWDPRQVFFFLNIKKNFQYN